MWKKSLCTVSYGVIHSSRFLVLCLGFKLLWMLSHFQKVHCTVDDEYFGYCININDFEVLHEQSRTTGRLQYHCRYILSFMSSSVCTYLILNYSAW